ncbi:hypothetical protein MTO96_011304 [Rhipicephalus appendiculatus]
MAQQRANGRRVCTHTDIGISIRAAKAAHARRAPCVRPCIIHRARSLAKPRSERIGAGGRFSGGKKKTRAAPRDPARWPAGASSHIPREPVNFRTAVAYSACGVNNAFRAGPGRAASGDPELEHGQPGSPLPKRSSYRRKAGSTEA